MSLRRFTPLAAALGVMLSCQVQADAAAANAQCGSCHALEAPDFATLGISERLDRSAPPLYYAGNKYQPGWLVEWLQAPTRLFPAGYYPNAAAIKATPEGDVPDPAALHQHVALDAAAATDMADYLMSLKPYDDLVAAVTYTPGKVAMRMGMMDFRKFKGCQSCHQDAAGEGGFSGPELVTASKRLQPAYMVSFIQNPAAWDPNTIMPLMEMNEAAVHKLVDYLKLAGGEE